MATAIHSRMVRRRCWALSVPWGESGRFGLLLAAGCLQAAAQEKEVAPPSAADVAAQDHSPRFYFGASVAALGDLDADGEEEIAVGIPGAMFANWTGAAIILSIPSGRTFRTIPGLPGNDFGWSLRSLRLDPKSASPLLAIEGDATRRPCSSMIVDPRTGRIVFELEDVLHVHGTQSDLDGDGIRELIVTATRKPTAVEALSGATCSPIPIKTSVASNRLIDLDIDGDGLLDFMRVPKSFDHELEFLSAASGESILRYPLAGAPAQRPWSFAATRADVDGDGRKELVLHWTATSRHASQLIAFHGPKLQSIRKLSETDGEEPRSETIERNESICNLGDINADKCDDIVVPASGAARETLTCYSGIDGAVLWETRDVVGPGSCAIDRVKDVDGDGIADVICGRAPPKGNNSKTRRGVIVLLSGKTGTILKSFDSRGRVTWDPTAEPPASKQPRRKSDVQASQHYDPDCSIFGVSIATLGDNDGDGIEEVAIGAPGAWTDGGRTGAVLIVRATDGGLLRTIAGTRHDGQFGFGVKAVRSNQTSKSLLSVPVEGIDARDRARVLCFDPTNSQLVREEAPAKNRSSIGFDLDGDGVLDEFRPPGKPDTNLVLVSGATKVELARLPMDTVRVVGSWRLDTLAGDFNGDGRKDLTVVWSDSKANTSQLFIFAGENLQERVRAELGENVPFSSSGWRDLYDCGDLNEDGSEDVLAAQAEFPRLSLTCYSGSNGAKLWKTEDVCDEDQTSVDRLRDLDGDGVNEVITGKVHYSTSGGYGDGVVFVLSGKTGRILNQFVEQDYPAISHAHYLESRK